MEGLSKRKKYLKTFFNSHAFLEDGEHLLQGLSEETNSNINTSKLYSIYGKANS